MAESRPRSRERFGTEPSTDRIPSDGSTGRTAEYRLPRRTVATALVAALAGCSQLRGGEAADDGDGNPALADASQQGDLRLESPAFADGESIPAEYGYEEANVNPPLEIANVPDEADSLVLVVDDPDAVEPAGEIWVHWLVWNVPPETTEIPEDWAPDDAVEGENDFGEVGYGGPDPPDDVHTYRFKCYALESTLDLEAGATVDELGDAIDGRVIARTQLTGTYAP